MVVGATRRLVLAGLRPFTELTLRVFAAVLPPVLDGRAISAPKGQQGHLIGPNLHSGRGETRQNRACRPSLLRSALGQKRKSEPAPLHVRSTSESGRRRPRQLRRLWAISGIRQTPMIWGSMFS